MIQEAREKTKQKRKWNDLEFVKYLGGVKIQKGVFSKTQLRTKRHRGGGEMEEEEGGKRSARLGFASAKSEYFPDGGYRPDRGAQRMGWGRRRSSRVHERSPHIKGFIGNLETTG